MSFKKTIVLITAVISCSNVFAATFQDFSGVCQGNSSKSLWKDGALGWDRRDISWGRLEPVEGKWNSKAFDSYLKSIGSYTEKGYHYLPTLCYVPGWAVMKKYTHIKKGKRYEYTCRNDGKGFDLIVSEKKDGKWQKSSEKIVRSPRIPIAADKVKDWEKYVEKVVSALMKPPYNIKYFQIWNEAHPNSGFWDGDMKLYFERIHKPAAKVIRRLGGRVVYGGWPDCGSLGMVKLFDKYKIWKTIDVVDCHYFWVCDYFWFYYQAEKRGRRNIGAWQTEWGFSRRYHDISTNYPVVLNWALTEGWNYTDKFKMFYFAQWSPNDHKAYGYGKCLYSGKILSPHGLSLKTLGDLYGNGELSVFKAYSTYPRLTPQGRFSKDLGKIKQQWRDLEISALQAGKRIILTVYLKQSVKDKVKKCDGQLKIKLQDLRLRSKIAKVERVGIFGARKDITDTLDRKKMYPSVIVDTNGDTLYNSPLYKEKNGQRGAFYVVFYLK